MYEIRVQGDRGRLPTLRGYWKWYSSKLTVGRFGATAAVLAVLIAVSPTIAGECASPEQGLRLENVNTEHVYFSYHGKPLLSFGGMSDFLFYAADDAYDYRKWADWQSTHGMNHCRAYVPGSWVHVEKFATENGGAIKNVLFPYQETEPGSRQFDLTKFDERYWERFREQCKYLESKGIIVDLLMFNGWQLWNYNRDVARYNWDGHFFNPRNNINAFTDHLDTERNKNNRCQFYHSVADGRNELFAVQKAYYEKIIEVTYDLDNIYYELVHELGMNYQDWDKTKQWIESVALAVRAKGDELNPERSIVLGTDGGHLAGFPFNQSGGYPRPGSEMDWVFTRPYFDVVIFGNCHHTGNAREWRRHYRKPYVAQEDTDDTGHKWSYRIPEHRHHLRKYLWKMMMAKCQQLDFYVKGGRPGFGGEEKPGFPHNYDPNAWNEFEGDARRLRRFFESIEDYGALDFTGHFFISPIGHNLVLASNKEVIAYVSSPTGIEGVAYAPRGAQIRLADLPLEDGKYTAQFFDPKSGPAGSKTIHVRSSTVNFRTPDFVDDYVVRIIGQDMSH